MVFDSRFFHWNVWKFSNLNTLSSLAHYGHENEGEKCSQTFRGLKKWKFQSRYQLGLLDMKVLADLDFKWSSEMSSFWDSGLGKISNLVADKLKCRFRATRVFQKKLRYPFQFWLKVFLAKMREWERVEQSNVLIWDRQIRDEELSDLGIFSSSNRELVFFF